MQRLRKRRNRTLAQQVKKLLLVLLIMLAVYAAGSYLILQRISEQTLGEMEQMSRLYTSELDNRFLRISRSLFSTMMKRGQPDSAFWKYVEMLQEKGQTSDYPVAKLRELYLSSAWEYGEEYQIFLYLSQSDSFYELSLTQEGGYTMHEKLQAVVKEQVERLKDTAYMVKKKWNIISCDGGTYMCKIAQNADISLGCVVNVTSILEPFSGLAMGKDGYVRLVDANGEVVGILTKEGVNPDTGEAYGHDRNFIQQELSQAPFVIQMRISSEQLMGVMKNIMIVLLILGFLLVGVGALILIYCKKYILTPVQRFTDNLERYDVGEYTYQLTEQKLLELEQIDDKFKRMIHQIRKLKITLYEQELENQKMEMEYLRLQIRPHFYLNCLNFIYSMIDFQQYGNAQKMSRVTADYLSYIFRNTRELVPVGAETDHCRNYLEILLLRYPQCFEYYFEVHDEVKDALIFPFLIQVFVENAAKHALTLQRKSLISVTVYPEDGEETFVNIYISDTGDGFPPEILEKLQNGEDLSQDGAHVGISNCVKRFRHYYPGSGHINFSNSPLGGAIVDIHIPYSRKEG